MTGIRKLYIKLKFRKVETLVYLFDLDEQIIPEVPVKDKIGIKISDTPDKLMQFSALIDGEVVNRNYVYKKNLLSRQLGYSHLPLIGGCSTDNNFRGRNIYPFMLTEILRWHKVHHATRQVLIFVDPKNISSIKGIEKAGFKKLKHAMLYRILGLCIYKRIHDF